jgi:hypothetical protein
MAIVSPVFDTANWLANMELGNNYSYEEAFVLIAHMWFFS